MGTGPEGPVAARCAIALAQRRLALEAGVHLCVRSFSVINTVGAASLSARLDCNAFASAHRATSHYDKSSFVGLAWRPPNKAICCGVRARSRAEVYGTGRANLPGSVVERALQSSWREMLPELLAHSSARAQLRLFPEAQDAPTNPDALSGWSDWPDAVAAGVVVDDDDGDDDFDDATLGALGL